MNTKYYLTEREGLASSMKQILHANIWSLACLEQSDYEEDVMLDYFNKSFEDPTCIQTENIIAAAVVRTIYSKPYIPQALKPLIAKKAVGQQIDTLFHAKLNYHEQVKGMGKREAVKRAEEHQKVQSVSVVDGIRRKATNISLGQLTRKIVEYVGDLFDVVVPKPIRRAVGWLIPEKVRKGVQEGAKIVLDEATKAVRGTIDYLGKRGVEIVEKAKPVIEKIGHTVTQVWDKAKETGKKVWNAGKNFAKTIFGFFN